MTQDPKILGLALLGGIIPSLLWLWFWLKEDKKAKEPKGLLTVIFILGMVSVVLVIPIQKFIQNNNFEHQTELALWAGVEEIVKYLVVLIILYKTNYADEPIDWPIYMMTAALGFAAFENTLFLIKPLSLGDTTVGLLTGQLRFLGSTLLHAVSSGIVGIFLGLSLYFGNFIKKIYLIIGLVFAITLHTVFNFFIMKYEGTGFIKVFAFLWVVTVIIMLLFEKLRRMSSQH
ncbi:MAG: PrsW family glutamic-type intramembrane protease [Patescibacteria group bacterium]